MENIGWLVAVANKEHQSFAKDGNGILEMVIHHDCISQFVNQCFKQLGLAGVLMVFLMMYISVKFAVTILGTNETYS
jgi:hypothetical protein